MAISQVINRRYFHFNHRQIPYAMVITDEYESEAGSRYAIEPDNIHIEALDTGVDAVGWEYLDDLHELIAVIGYEFLNMFPSAQEVSREDSLLEEESKDY